MDPDYPEDRLAREPAPPYEGEGACALWHFSENPSLGRFQPRTLPLCTSLTPSSRTKRASGVRMPSCTTAEAAVADLREALEGLVAELVPRMS